MFIEKVFVVACFNLKLCRDGFGFSAFNTVRLGSFIIQPAVCVCMDADNMNQEAL